MKVAVAAPGHAKAGNSYLRPGILLDRDGTIIVDHGYVGSIDRVEFIEGAPEAIAGFNRAGIPVAVVTNQAGVARGLYGIDDVARVHDTSQSAWPSTAPTSTCFCTAPTTPRESSRRSPAASEDRKPRPGMAKAAAARSTST